MDTGTRVIEIRYQGETGSVLKVSLDDETVLIMDADHPAADAAIACRNSGLPVDPSVSESLRQADELYRCRRKALDLLARSEQCRRGLEAKLARKGWSRPAISTALDRLESAGFLDDRRFAEAWVRSRLTGRPEGQSKLIGSLMSRGVAGGTARAAVESVFSEMGEDTDSRMLERAWQKVSRRRNITEEQLIASLVRRGFAPGTVRRFLAARERDPD